jgi:hypothetical protein
MKDLAIKVINTVITISFFIVAAPFLIPAAAITWVTMGNPFHLDADGAAAFFTMQILAVVIAIATGAFAIGYFL